MIAQTCRKQWVAPRLATLNWDSKLMPSLSNQHITEERLTVVIGTASELKLLGVPSYKAGTDRTSGDIISELTVELLESWHCADSVVNMTFDTAASNTGFIVHFCGQHVDTTWGKLFCHMFSVTCRLKLQRLLT